MPSASERSLAAAVTITTASAIDSKLSTSLHGVS